MPLVGFGTWDLHGETLRNSLEAALDAGYRYIDAAEGYQNEDVVGDVIAEWDRDELFLSSKVLGKNLNYESVIDACNASLDRLGTDYLDLYLIHWPNPAISLRETLSAMADLHEEGKVRNIGVSNFQELPLSVAHHITKVPVSVNQIEYHPWFQRPDLVEYCEKTETRVVAAAPLARTEVFADETIQELADAYEKTPAQIVLRWMVEKDIAVIPRSSSPEHIRENFAIFDWELDESDHHRLDGLHRDSPVFDVRSRDWTDEIWGIPPYKHNADFEYRARER